jgi:hypothetical protein
MIHAKTLADTLTGARFLLGIDLMVLGLQRGVAAAATASLTLFVAWITDALDGPLARRDPRALRTWIGNHDLEADLMVGLGTWVYLALAGSIPLGLTVAYGAAGAAALWHFNLEPLAWGLQALPYGAMIWNAWRVVPTYGLLLVGYVILIVVATWPRFLHRSHAFVVGMRDLLRQVV